MKTTFLEQLIESSPDSSTKTKAIIELNSIKEQHNHLITYKKTVHDIANCIQIITSLFSFPQNKLQELIPKLEPQKNTLIQLTQHLQEDISKDI